MARRDRLDTLLMGDEPVVGPSEQEAASSASQPATSRILPHLQAVPAEEADKSSPSAKAPPDWGAIRRTLNPAVNSIAGAFEVTATSSAELEDIKKQMAAGATIVDLDPELISPSFVSDRMEINEADVKILSDQIAKEGQLIPILVRPHPEQNGRYQAAFGHRRRLACIVLGRPVKAIIRELTDAELIIAQGQENNARLNTSFIERARFAKALVDHGTDRPTVAAALSISNVTQIGWYLNVLKNVPDDIVVAIGPAPEVGRRRWDELAEIFKLDKSAHERALAFASREDFHTRDSDNRFAFIVSELSRKPRTLRAAANYWKTPDGVKLATISGNDGERVVKFDGKLDNGFGDFVIARLDQLYKDYKNA